MPECSKIPLLHRLQHVLSSITEFCLHCFDSRFSGWQCLWSTVPWKMWAGSAAQVTEALAKCIQQSKLLLSSLDTILASTNQHVGRVSLSTVHYSYWQCIWHWCANVTISYQLLACMDICVSIFLSITCILAVWFGCRIYICPGSTVPLQERCHWSISMADKKKKPWKSRYVRCIYAFVVV